MSSTNLKIYVNFPTWDSISESMKPLINFFMKHAAMVFHGDYQDETFQYMSGNIRNKYYSKFDIVETFDQWCCSFEFDIAYFDYLVDPEDPADYPKAVCGFPDGETTVIQKSSYFDLIYIDDSSYSEPYTYFGYIDYFFYYSIPVTLTPKVGDVIINNSTLKPKYINTNYNHIVQIPIETVGLNFQYDFQIRTSSFYIDDGEGGIDADVFYKIGICPIEEYVSFNDLVSLLKENKLIIKSGDFLYYHLLDSYTAVGKEYSENSNYKFTPNFIFPLKYLEEGEDYTTSYGYAYIELYNQDGTLFTQDLSNKTVNFYLRPSENAAPVPITISVGLSLNITDQSLDQGFVLTPLPESFVVFTETFSTNNA